MNSQDIGSMARGREGPEALTFASITAHSAINPSSAVQSQLRLAIAALEATDNGAQPLRDK